MLAFNPFSPGPPQRAEPLNDLRMLAERLLGPIGHPTSDFQPLLCTDPLLVLLHASSDQRDRLLLQFLTARSGDASAAFTMLRSTLHWRHAHNVHNLPLHHLSNPEIFPLHIISNPSSCKQPVVYGLVRLLDRRHTLHPSLFQPALIAFLEALYYQHTYNHDQIALILDFDGWSLRRHAPPYTLIKDALQLMQDYYPDRLAHVFLVNCPTCIRTAYLVVMSFVHVDVRRKFISVKTGEEEHTLKTFLGPNCVPTFWGGRLNVVFPSTWLEGKGNGNDAFMPC